MSDILEVPETEAEIEENLEILKVTSTQRKNIDEESEIIANRLGMPLITIKGFYVYAIIKNQKDKKTSLAEQEAREDIRSLTQEELEKARIKNAKIIYEEFKIKIDRVVRIKKKEHLLDQALEEALQYYIENYVSRPPDV